MAWCCACWCVRARCWARNRVSRRSCSARRARASRPPRQRVDAIGRLGPRQERGADVLATERDRETGEGDRPEQLVVIDLAEAGAAILVLRLHAVVLDAEAPHLAGALLQVRNHVLD